MAQNWNEVLHERISLKSLNWHLDREKNELVRVFIQQLAIIQAHSIGVTGRSKGRVLYSATIISLT